MTEAIRTSCYYFPPISIFSQIACYESWFLDVDEKFSKKTFRNSTLILGSQGVQLLTVPLKKGKTYTAVQDVAISYDEDWPRKHLRAISSAYGKCPFFPFYFQDIENILLSRYDHLWELDFNIAKWLSEQIQLEVKVSSSANLDASKFDSENQVLSRSNYGKFKIEPYYQPFSPNLFQNNLSILDKIMNIGFQF